ncbi:MAG TPA: Na+/H+ antiporter NhaC family protein [Rectinemataceae bacterium]|nr:Na+/H+ antiporter NhaC family protein [Rectinemataceae bacterium]
MDVPLGILFMFLLLVFSVLNGIFVGYALAIGFFVFAFMAWRRKFSAAAIVGMAVAGGGKALQVIKIFVLIGGLTSIWMASGTVPGIIYYGIQYLNPKYFLLYAFLISCVVSFLLGTSLGTASTVGVALVLIAKSGDIDMNMIAGAIMSGVYFGDRCSPMSSSAYLVATLTRTRQYTNIKNMLKTSVLPFIAALACYFVLSLRNPLASLDTKTTGEIAKAFDINIIVMAPVFLVLFLSVLRTRIVITISAGLVSAFGIAMLLNHYAFADLLRFILLGFTMGPDSPLRSVLKGGGLLSMVKASVVVLISCALSGIYEGTGMLRNMETLMMRAKSRTSLFAHTMAVSIATASFGCNQTIATVLTHQIMKKSYESKGIEAHEFALDLENTGIVLAAMIPWNVAAFAVTSSIGVDSAGYLPFAFYLYLLPLFSVSGIGSWRKRKT